MDELLQEARDAFGMALRLQPAHTTAAAGLRLAQQLRDGIRGEEVPR